MLQWLLGKSIQATRAEDSLWMSRAARLTGICREVARLAAAGRSVLVVALTPTALDELAAALAQHQPLRCAGIFERDALRRQLGQPGTVAVALTSALPADMQPASDMPVEILVCGRNTTRTSDDAILRFAEPFGASARVTFHVAVDDPLLQPHIESFKLITKIGVAEDEAIASPLITHAIERIQSK